MFQWSKVIKFFGEGCLIQNMGKLYLTFATVSKLPRWQKFKLAIKCLSVFKIILKSSYLLVSSKSFRCLLRVTPSSQVSATIRGKIGDVTFRATIGEMGQDWMEAGWEGKQLKSLKMLESLKVKVLVFGIWNLSICAIILLNGMSWTWPWKIQNKFRTVKVVLIFFLKRKRQELKLAATRFGKLSRQVDQRGFPSPRSARRGSTGHLIETRSDLCSKVQNSPLPRGEY